MAEDPLDARRLEEEPQRPFTRGCGADRPDELDGHGNVLDHVSADRRIGRHRIGRVVEIALESQSAAERAVRPDIGRIEAHGPRRHAGLLEQECQKRSCPTADLEYIFFIINTEMFFK